MMKRVLTASLLVAVLLMSACGKDGGKKTLRKTAGYMKVSLMTGKAEARLSGGAFRPVRVGMLLRESDIVKTVGANSSCSLSTPGGSVIRLGGDSLLVMKKLYRDGKINVEKTGLELLAGRVIVKAKKLFDKESFTVRTKTATAGVRGTQFVVSIDKNNNTSVGVKTGRVLVSRKLRDKDKKVDTVVKKIAEENTVLLSPAQQVVIRSRDNHTIIAAAKSEMTTVKAKSAKIPSVRDVVEGINRRVRRRRIVIRLRGVRFNYRTDRRLRRDFNELERLEPDTGKAGRKKMQAPGKVRNVRHGIHRVPGRGDGDESALNKKHDEEALRRKRRVAERRRLLEARRRRFEAERRRALNNERALRRRKTHDDRE